MRSFIAETAHRTISSINKLIPGRQLHKNGHNGYESNGHSKERPKPAYQLLFERTLATLSQEDIVELTQGRALEIALSRRPYHVEDGEDQVKEGRRLSSMDVYTYFKRSDLEVKRYKTILDAILKHPQKDLILQEITLRWTTSTNLTEIATLIPFTVEDVQAFEQELRSTTYTASTRASETTIDTDSELYQLIMEAFSEDDIVPLVLARDLMIHSQSKPSLQLLAVGLQNYLKRGFIANIRRNDPLEAKVAILNSKTRISNELRKIAQSRG